MELQKNLIYARMREARLSERPKATLEDISARLAVNGITLTFTAISKIELGIRPVTDIQLMAIAKVLRVSPAWLLGLTDEKYYNFSK